MKRIILLFIVLAVTSCSSEAQNSPSDKEALEKIIENYITNHPEVIESSLKNYYDKQRKAQEDAAFHESMKQRYEVPIGSSPVKGPKQAPVTIVEFSDFQCPYCARSVEALKEIDNKYKGKIKFVFKHFPLENIHPLARSAARASMAAMKQGKFWEYHDTLLNNQSMWSRGDKDAMFEQYAKGLGLSVEQFRKDLAADKDDKQINEDMALAKKLNVGSTPTFFINGVPMRGLGAPSYFYKVIDAVMKEKQ